MPKKIDRASTRNGGALLRVSYAIGRRLTSKYFVGALRKREKMPIMKRFWERLEIPGLEVGDFLQVD
jgi:hypothetical protein